MKYRTAISIILASILALSLAPGYAQKGGGAGGGAGSAADRTRQVDRDRTYDRDRIHDRDRIRDQEIDKDMDRDRMQGKDPSSMSDEDIYGSALMSEEERNRYRKQLAEQETKQARDRYQVQHERKMQDRAIQQGRELVPPGQGKVYGGELMSLQERNEYREQLRQLKSEDERMQFQAQHREKIDERAEALKLQVEEAE